MNLSSIEKDILGDLSQDSHELWEWYAFFRHHYSDLDESEVLSKGRELFSVWTKRGWLKISKSRKDHSALAPEDFLRAVDELGPKASDPDEGTLLLELSDRAYSEVSWLRARW